MGELIYLVWYNDEEGKTCLWGAYKKLERANEIVEMIERKYRYVSWHDLIEVDE